jgi:hypothetical protein
MFMKLRTKPYRMDETKFKKKIVILIIDNKKNSSFNNL